MINIISFSVKEQVKDLGIPLCLLNNLRRCVFGYLRSLTSKSKAFFERKLIYKLLEIVIQLISFMAFYFIMASLIKVYLYLLSFSTC